jgi:glycosyltransferase 2 family protein
MEETPANTALAKTQLRVWPFLKWGLFAVVMVFVGRRALQLWRDSPPTELHIDIRWLIPAAVMYLIGWLPSVWFWRALLKRMHQRVGWYEAIRAHYVGQVGKYLPGKALVLILRGSLVSEAGANPVFAGVTAAYETLVFMWAGTALALALAPLTLPDSFWQQMPLAVQGLRQPVWLLPLIVLVGTIASTPFSAWLFTLVGRKALPRDLSAPQPPAFTAGLMVQGAFITSLGWLCHALSLGCTLQAVSDRPFDLVQFPVWLASVCVSTVGGFVILVAPGGLGVREWLLVEMLKDQPDIGPARAVVVAGLLRAVWFVAELVAAGVLFTVKPALPESSFGARDESPLNDIPPR